MAFNIDELILDGKASDPSNPSDGCIWYRSDLKEFRIRKDGQTKNLIVEGFSISDSIDGGTAATKNVGVAAEDVPEIGATLGGSEIVETDSEGKLITVSKGTAYNKEFGTGAGSACEGNDSRLSGGTQTVRVVRSADKSVVSNTVLAPDGELEFAIGAAETWIFQICLISSEIANNPDIIFRMGAFDGLTGSTEYAIHSLKTSSESSNLSDFVTASSSFTLTTDKRGIVIMGSVTSINAGTLKLEWAQDFSDVDATIVHKHSYLLAHKV